MFCDLRTGVILIAEDNPDEALLVHRAFKKAGISMTVHIVANGDEATNYLRGEHQYADRTQYPFPRVLITDLKMPRCNGLELLERIQLDEKCCVFPKFVLSASPDEKDVERAFKSGANSYFLKPGTFDELVALVKFIHEICRKSVLPTLALQR